MRKNPGDMQVQRRWLLTEHDLRMAGGRTVHAVHHGDAEELSGQKESTHSVRGDQSLDHPIYAGLRPAEGIQHSRKTNYHYILFIYFLRLLFTSRKQAVRSSESEYPLLFLHVKQPVLRCNRKFLY
jgi:hypothetical protein